MALVSLAVMVTGVAGMLSVSVSNVGTVVGQTKELTFGPASAGLFVQGTVEAFGIGASVPACATAAASTFADIASFSLNWGTSLQGNTDYETFFCIGNIGTSALTLHVSTSGQATGETEVFEEQNNGGVLGLSYSPCDGASIAGLGVIVVRAHLHTPSVGLNGSVSLTGKTTFTAS
jgi:hypothetical protein